MLQSHSEKKQDIALALNFSNLNFLVVYQAELLCFQRDRLATLQVHDHCCEKAMFLSVSLFMGK